MAAQITGLTVQVLFSVKQQLFQYILVQYIFCDDKHSLGFKTETNITGAEH